MIREKGSNTPVQATSDIFEYNHPSHISEFKNGKVRGVVKVPANTLDPAKKYVVEVWTNNGYKNGENAGPVVGKAPEGRSELLASQDLNFKGSDADEGKQPSLTDEQRKERATRGELTAALYAQAGSPKVNLPAVSPWPDVKTTDPNYAPMCGLARRVLLSAGRTASSMLMQAFRTLPLRRSPTVRLVPLPLIMNGTRTLIWPRILRSTVRLCGLVRTGLR